MAGLNPFDTVRGGAANPFDEARGRGAAGVSNPFDAPRAGRPAAAKKPTSSAIDKFEAIAGAPQRALQALETGADIGHAFMHPEDAKKLSASVKDKSGLTNFENTTLAGNDPLHKFARGALDTGLDVLNDPLTFVPIGKGAKLLGKAIPKIGELAAHGAEAVEGSKIGQWLAPEYKARHLTDEGRAAVSLAEHHGEDAARAARDKALATVRQHAEAIRAGQMPDPVRALFRDPSLIPQAAAGLKPQDVLKAAYQDADSIKSEITKAHLEKAGVLGSPEFIRGMGEAGPAKFFKDPTKVAEAQAALTEPAKKGTNALLDAARGLTHAGNKAFLVSPLPHTINLMVLSFLKYGAPTTIKGLANAVQVATGHVGPDLAKDIEALRSVSADSKYGAIFDELGLTKLLGSEAGAKAFNAVTKPMQRLSNAAQEHILNPMETGLRSAALGAERKAGSTAEGAARNIHGAFGTDAANQLTRTASDMAQPFAKFHLQTAPAAGLGAMVKHPGRIQALAHEDTDMNAQGGPAAFHLNAPGFSTMRGVTDPLGYGAAAFGPIGQAAGPYSPITLLRESYKGFQSGNQKLALKKASEAMSEVAGRFIPESEAMLALYRMAQGKKAKTGEDPLADLASSIVTGGFFQKASP